jgi:phage shock protein A
MESKELPGDAFQKYAEAEAQADKVRQAADKLRQQIEDLIGRVREISAEAAQDPPPSSVAEEPSG